MGRVFLLGDAVSTDAIIPGRFNLTTDPAQLAESCLIEHRPDFAATVQPGDVLVAGRNFGCGSSREHAPVALQASGLAAIVAASFARIFYRNAVNIGLPLLVCPELHTAVHDGEEITVDTGAGVIRCSQRVFTAEPPSAVAQAIARAGSLVDLIRTSGWTAIEELHA